MSRTSIVLAALLLSACGGSGDVDAPKGQRREAPDAGNQVRYREGTWTVGPVLPTAEGPASTAWSRMAADRLRIVVDLSGRGHELFMVRCSPGSFRIERYWLARVDGAPVVARVDGDADYRVRRVAEAPCAGRLGGDVLKGNAMRVLFDLRRSAARTEAGPFNGLARPSRQR